MVAVLAGQIAVVETLLKGGAIVDATDTRGLHVADPRRRARRRSTSSTFC